MDKNNIELESQIATPKQTIVQKPGKRFKAEASQARARARKVAQLMIQHNLTKSEAMRRVGYTEQTIKSGHHHAIRSEFQRLLNAAIPPEAVIEALKRGIDSKVVKEFLNPQTGEVVEGRPQTDYHASAKFVSLYAQVFGLTAREDFLNVQHNFSLAQEIAAARQRASTVVDVVATPVGDREANWNTNNQEIQASPLESTKVS